MEQFNNETMKMLQSKLFTKTIKEVPKDETSFNAQVLIKAGFIDKLSAGVYSFLPLGLRVLNKIENVIRDEMDNIGGQEVLMPALSPKENWDKTGRWDSLDVLFKVSGADEKEYALGATHEEVVSPLAKRFIFSYKDLPMYPYQIQTKFRNEPRAKAGLMRGREFSMKDLYSFSESQADLDKFYEMAKQAYSKVYDRLGVGDITYLTYASGGTFSKYSHEYQTLCEAGEDIIYICDKCRVAINEEIIEEQTKCPICGRDDLRKERSAEVGNIFKLGNKYTIPFDVKYTDKEGRSKDVIMGCYGIGPSRLMGTIVEVSHDDRGIIWPKEIAPFQIHIVGLFGKEGSDEVKEKALHIYNELKKKGVDVLFDDREDVSAGEKFADADLIGCPLRIVVSSKTLKEDTAECKGRSEQEAKFIKINNLIKEIVGDVE